MKCKKCHYEVDIVNGVLIVSSHDTADGLSYCPPNPDAKNIGVHRRSK